VNDDWEVVLVGWVEVTDKVKVEVEIEPLKNLHVDMLESAG